MNTKTKLLYVGFRALSTCCLYAAFLMITSCGDNVVNPDSPEPDGEDMIPVTVSRVEDGSYMESHVDTPDTTGGRTLVDEWVPVKESPASRAIPAAVLYEGPSAVRMTLREEPQVTTRAATLGNGIYFRLIAFRKVGSNYVFQSAADFTTNGASAPTLRQGNLLTRAGTVRVIGYSFNSTAAMGTIPSSYTYNSTSVTIPNMNSDFMVYDSGDIANVSTISHNLSVSFTQKLCKLTVKLSLSQFGSNTFTNCTGVYVSQGGNVSAWTIGPSTNNVSANTGNTPTFNIANNSTATVRLVPFSGSRAITVHIGTLKLSNYFNANNRNITSSQNVQLLPGKSYTITLKFELGIQLAASDINLTQNGCTASDKNYLAKLRWATGNLKSTGSTNYIWAPSQTETGYYYTWYSTYTGNKTTNNTDPCSKLHTAYYGTGWRTPSENDYIPLSRCTDKVLTNGGMWFMNKSIGIFLLAAGTIGNGGGSATSNPNYSTAKTGQYWTSKKDGENRGISFTFNPSSTFMFSDYQATGIPVRCVK
ncbi:fimbrillin family protein [Bacteroides fragilis]|uniref:fimbrillin family protein n=1 Tax=Bacteroides fragilis TaxID=817 RepID=UPI001C222D8D|nr:fimbrillin family protein [Bacteroides fragilis]MBU9020406.1 fimbrillin family protein [Bacteroides fragilis]MBU9024845.1 fimbrillin family protein [Bacteroides fragilis]MBU9085349.1 fimbrillin family protein [Bacteroides fragilis]